MAIISLDQPKVYGLKAGPAAEENGTLKAAHLVCMLASRGVNTCHSALITER